MRQASIFLVHMPLQARKPTLASSSVCNAAGYAVNSPFLNHCITSFLKRIASPDALDLEPMLYQVRSEGVRLLLTFLLGSR